VRDWSVVMLLFFFTGMAIVIYLNQTPFQPRERDYAYVGSSMPSRSG
jgi:phage shock protein PspC (stress-responsive transcriptional regulator)